MTAEVNVLGRRFRPVVVALVVAMAALLLAGIFERGLLGGTPWGAIEAGTAALALIHFGAGWWAHSLRLMTLGLAFAFVTLAARSAFLFMITDIDQPAPWLSLSLTIVAGGSYWIERVHGAHQADRG